jgi:hypothetical protein
MSSSSAALAYRGGVMRYSPECVVKVFSEDRIDRDGHSAYRPPCPCGYTHIALRDEEGEIHLARRTLYLPVMITAALGVLALTLVVAPAAMAQTASVEGESFTHPRGTAVVHDQMYSGGAALKFEKSKAVATKQVTISEASTVLVRARADQKKGGSPTLTIRVDGENSGTLRITSSALADYNYPAVTLQPGTYTIGLKGGNIAQGRNVFVDVVSFPAVEVEPPPDTTAPTFTILSGRTDGEVTNQNYHPYTWEISDDVGVETVICQIFDANGNELTPGVVRSPLDNFPVGNICYDNGPVPEHNPVYFLSNGAGNFTVEFTTTDAASNETVVTRTFTVDHTTPVVTMNQDVGDVSDGIANPTWTVSEPVATTECRLSQTSPSFQNIHDWQACASGDDIAVETNKIYWLEVHATDPAGNVGTRAMEVAGPYDPTLQP